MAKKKKKITWTPLQETTIGFVNKNKYGWIGVLILFLLFIGVIFFLPDLQELYENYTKTNIPEKSGNLEKPINPDKSDDSEESELPTYPKYYFTEEEIVSIDNLKFSNFIYNQNELRFSVINPTENNIELKDLYIELYDESDVLLNRIYLTGSIASYGNLNYDFSKVKPNASYFTLHEIKEDDYTYIGLEMDENNKTYLTCSLDNRNIRYTFLDEKLILVEDKFVYSKDNSDYEEKFNEFNTNYIRYSETLGIDTHLRTSTEQFTYEMNINYETFAGKLPGEFYFSAVTSPREVSFKMQAMFFECR